MNGGLICVIFKTCHFWFQLIYIVCLKWHHITRLIVKYVDFLCGVQAVKLQIQSLCVCCSHALSDGALGGWSPVQKQSQDCNQRQQPAAL